MRKLGFAYLLAIVVAPLATIAFADSDNPRGAQEFELLGPDGNAHCEGDILAGTAGGYGFALINASPDGTISATVSVKLTPNTTYTVRLIQGDDGCLIEDATITTNSQGRATVHVAEASTSDHAWVYVYNWSAGEHYVTESYWH